MTRTTMFLAVLLAACGPADAGTCEGTILYPDADGDGFGRSDAAGINACLRVGASNLEIPVGYSLNNLDCAPDDSRAFPGQVAWQMLPVFGSTAHLWDFNCDGLETLQFPGAPGVCPSGPTCGGSAASGDFWTGATIACGQTGTWIAQCAVVAGACKAITELRVQGCL